MGNKFEEGLGLGFIIFGFMFSAVSPITQFITQLLGYEREPILIISIIMIVGGITLFFIGFRKKNPHR